jgi:hypothetical protein
MKKVYPVLLLIVFSPLFFQACNEGISPPVVTSSTGPKVSGFSGTIAYAHWPPPDSILDLRLIAFKSFPPANIVTEVLGGRAIVYPPLGDTTTLPLNVDTTHYFVQAPAGEYQYVVVAQRYGQNIFSDWRAVGQYDLDTNLAVPSSIEVPTDDTLKHVDISVDFTHLPPQPF